MCTKSLPCCQDNDSLSTDTLHTSTPASSCSASFVNLKPNGKWRWVQNSTCRKDVYISGHEVISGSTWITTRSHALCCYQKHC